MHIMYDDNTAPRATDSFRLILLNSGWYIVANGYLCKVTDEEEGRRALASLSAGPRRTGNRRRDATRPADLPQHTRISRTCDAQEAADTRHHSGD